MVLWRREGFAEDAWTFLADDAPAPADGAIVVSLKRWLAEREALTSRNAPVGVAVEAGADAQAHLAELAGRPLIALAFAKFADGRAFSYARLLRDRYGFRGELRAIGDVLIDEIPLMLRCGFDSFDVTNAPTLQALKGRPPAGLAAPLSAEQRRRRGCRRGRGRGGESRPAGSPLPLREKAPRRAGWGYSRHPFSSRRATASMTAMPSALSLRHGMAAKFSPPASRK